MNPTTGSTNYNSNYNYDSNQGGNGDTKGFNPNYNSVFGTQNKNSQNFYNNQYGNIGAFTDAYNAATKALPSYQKLLNDANTQYNVQPLAQNAASLQNSLNLVPQTYSQATMGSDTNNNQLQQLIGQKQWELAPQAAAATNQAQTAQGLANNMVNYGIQNEGFLTQPYQTEAGMLTSSFGNAASGFNQAQSDQLAALNAKLAQGVSLTNTELQQKTELEKAQLDYNARIYGYNTQQQAANYKTQYNIPAGSYVYNSSTGRYQLPGQ